LGGLRRRGLCGFAVVAALALAAAGSAAARPAGSPPRAFFGVVPQGSLGAADFARMRGVVGTLRVPVYWPDVEPRPGELELGSLDATVSAAAEAGVRVLPFVYGTPPWLASDPARPPLSAGARRAWAGFLRALVSRYGRGGTLWRGASAPLPIRMWQVWNEPNFLLFWRPRPAPTGYARLLEVSAHAIRARDPRALVVTAGVAPVEGGMLPWVYLRRLLAIRGIGRSVDVVAVHPYASHLTDVAYQVRLARRAMARSGLGRLPLLVSEFGVASHTQTASSFNRGARGQAKFLRRAYRMLLRKRHPWHIAGVDWYAWQDAPFPDPHCVFCQYAGLVERDGAPKPAWWALRGLASR